MVDDTAQANDQVNATVTQAPPVPQPNVAGTPVSQVSSAPHAASVLKEKVGLLHTVVNNMTHFGTLAVDDVEALIADIKYLITFGRSATKK